MEIPQRLQSVRQKMDAGEFASAFHDLERRYDERCGTDRLLKAELLLRRGDLEHAEALSRGVLDLRAVHSDLKGRALEHLGYIARHRGHLDDAIEWWEQSLHTARRHDDIEQSCRSQLFLLATKADVYGPEAVGTLLSEVRLNATRAGSPSLQLMVHLRLAEVEARRSAFLQAERHLKMVLSLLPAFPNVSLEARCLLLYGVVAQSLARPASAILHSSRALDFARRSGDLFVETAALVNLAHLYTSAGEFQRARQLLTDAQRIGPDWYLLRLGLEDNLARLALVEGKDENARMPDTSIPEPGMPYARVEAVLTSIARLRKGRDLRAALMMADSGATAARARAAHVLFMRCLLAKSEILMDLGRRDDARETLQRAGEADLTLSLDMVAEFERLQGRLSADFGASRLAHTKRARAARIWSALGDVASRSELPGPPNAPMDRAQSAKRESPHPAVDSANDGTGLLQSLGASASMLAVADHPLLLGGEILAVLEESGRLFPRAALIAVRDDACRVLHHWNCPEIRGSRPLPGVFTLDLGEVDGTAYQLWVEASKAFGGIEVLQLLRRLVASATELRKSRREDLGRASLWPIDVALPDAGPMFYSQAMRELRRQALRIAGTELKVLITGDTGVGKEVIARLIHGASKRAGKAFEAVNCASVPVELFEAHLFGFRRGAFTGAISDSPGVIRGNEGGTIFFDEIGELSLDSQVKLLRVLDAHEVHPLGASRAVSVDFRVIAATNVDLHALTEGKRFREDLYYRLNVATLHVPPLRERREEILPFVQHFLSVFCAENHTPLPRLADDAREYLLLYDWPGNIRELRNEVERLAGLVEDSVIKASDLKPEILASRRTRHVRVDPGPDECVIRLDQKLQDTYDEITRHAIVASLKRHGNNLEVVAKELGITRKGLYNKRLRFGML
jgi:DNA-binding NtrC family response regulator/tetratricopeptide (TPR) repeat protein